MHIPKGNGKETRPIGIPTTEDKVLQRSVAMLLEPIYEEEFLDFSYGFRPGRSAHQALDRIWKQIMNEPIQWIVEVDIRKFFDTLDHSRLRAVLRQRVTDGVITKLIDKWLKAGVLEQKQLSYPEKGTPQGGVISQSSVTSSYTKYWTNGSSKSSSLDCTVEHSLSDLQTIL